MFDLFIDGTCIAGIKCISAGFQNEGEGVVVRVYTMLFHVVVQEDGGLRMTCSSEGPNYGIANGDREIGYGLENSEGRVGSKEGSVRGNEE
jgi:hypothetical protein